MASREKRPLAPSKSKQKASGESGSPPNELKSKKGKSLPNIKQQQLSREVFDTVETGSQPPAKLESSLPRKKALKNLKRKQNLRVTKANLIKSRVTKKATNKNTREVSPDIKKGAKAKRVKPLEESALKAIGIALKLSENQTNSGDNEGKGTETPSKSAKNNLRTKKTKSTSSRSIGGGSSNEDTRDKEEASVASSAKSSPKLGKKKAIETADSLSKSAKTAKSANLKKNNIKYIVAKVTENDNKTKGRKSTGKEPDCGISVKSNTSLEKFSKAVLDDKNSIDHTIDEVIASMLSDSEADSQQGVTEKIEGKVTRSRKMLVDENIASDIEIKKEPDTEDTKATSDGEYAESTDQGPHFQNAIQLRKRSKVPVNNLVDQVFQRSLRNGKQRHLSDSGNPADVDPRRRRLNSEGPPTSDNSIEHTSDCNVSTDSCFSNPSCNESQTNVSASKEEISLIKDEVSKSFDEGAEAGTEVENNNNGDRVDRTGEIGPTLRSKTKAKTAESEAMKDDDAKIEEWISSKSVEIQDDSKKLNNLDQVRKDSILAKFTDKSKGSRRNSLNIDMKKAVNSFYNADKSDGNSKSQIDQMIESIKLNIAKSIESKIFGPGLSKNFDVPKIEEVIAPLSTESQKMGLEENTDEDKSVVTENEITSESSENSVPKVADTAKEIEKLVMFDIEEAETHSQNIQENKASGSNRINDVHNTCESTCNISSSNNGTSHSSVDELEVGNDDTASGASVNVSDNESKTSDENKKAVTTRKSSRISDKSSDSATGSPEAKKPHRNKVVSKSDNAEDGAADTLKSTKNEETASVCDSRKEDATFREPSDDRTASSSASALTSSERAEERSAEECAQTKSTEESAETELLNVSLNVSVGSEESETLESISREVERLVAEDQAAKPLPNPANDATRNKEAVSCDTEEISKEQEIQSVHKQEETLARCDDSSAQLESAANFTSETPSKSYRADGGKAATDATETSQQEGDAFCKMAQSTKHHKTNNNHLPTITANCDSSSECSSVNPVPIRTSTSDRQNDEIEEDKLDRDSDCKESNKIDDNLAANCDTPKNSDENETLGQKSGHNDAASTADESNKSSDDKGTDEQKPVNEENRRVLRARDKREKKATEGSRQTGRGSREHADGVKVKTEEAGVQKTQNASVQMDSDEIQGAVDETIVSESSQKAEDTSDAQNNDDLDVDLLESQARTRRSKEGKRRREEPLMPLAGNLKPKRAKRDLRKSDQQNKEETLLDNEVAKINENNRSFLNKYAGDAASGDSFRGFFENAQGGLDKNSSNLRSKSENDLVIDDGSGKNVERLSRNLSENHVSKRDDDIDILSNACKTLKTPEASAQKDSDETSTSSSESSNSATSKILETPEDKVKKESILRVLGLESTEKAAERKARREQQYTGTLKTIIRPSQSKDKRGSRSPLKIVLKQQGRGDGESDSPEFYTIQKEVRVQISRSM